MDANSIIFQMPFDESDGALIAYDYSQNRADGSVVGAHFVAGKNGNAISFGGDDYCEVSKSILPNMNTEFSILAWVQGRESECGSPQKMIWVLSFSGLNNFVEVTIEAKPGSWFSLAVTRRGSTFNFYVNSQLIKTVNNSGALQGISLNQDYYGGEYGFGLLDDVKIYKVALLQADLINELSSAKQQAYLLDGVDFKDYGVYVSGSDGILNRPKLKAPASLSWDNYHGESVDLMHKFFESREITLSCFVKAESKMDFIKRVSDFEALFDKQGTNRLVIDVHPIKPLIYEVYCKDAIEIQKTWDDDLMVGTFKLKLIEPEPVKRVLKHIRISEATKTCTITLTTSKLVNIYWGDGSVDYDISGDSVKVKHDYANNGDYFPVITGCIEEIKSFETNAIVVWERI
ncbi:MAG: LamG domain-containing protein [Bacteroides pyogenes]|uniref:LamG domain-containing protein n=1 Tax=Bacteroides pyogenes TaxID=310300 RepID=UPI002430324C|nr:LamG domain-containing protein [Bacteroides pyogenes]MCI7070046.1 LamG domain-containing protein [Bacteroides pyogenes]